MHSDDEPKRQKSSAIVVAQGFTLEARKSMEQLHKDYQTVQKLKPRYADMIDEVGIKHALIVAAEYCYLLQHDEQEFCRELSTLLPEDPLCKNAIADLAFPILEDYDFTVQLVADRARYFCAAPFEAFGLNSAIRMTTNKVAQQIAQEHLYYQLEKGRPYVPGIHQIRREASWKNAFPNLMISEMLDAVGNALHDAYYPRLVLEEHAKWGGRYIAFDSFIDKDFIDDCEDIEAFQDGAHPKMSKHSFRVYPVIDENEWDIEKLYGIGASTPSLDEVLYSREYLEHLDDAKRDLNLSPRDPVMRPIENVLRVYYLFQHALAYETLERELEEAQKQNPSNKPDLTFDSYELMVKAHRHSLAHQMQDYVCMLRSRFADLHVEDEAQKIGAEWEQMLREE